MNNVSEIKDELDDQWIPVIYKKKVRSQRTRSHGLDVPARENRAVIQHTLLGIELKVGNRRFACPDLSTARYLQIFASLGCGQIAVPYDITRISGVADELENSWHKTVRLIGEAALNRSPAVRGRMRAALIRKIREEIGEIGAGSLMPEFKLSVKQRS